MASPQQIRAARGFLDWSQEQLANKAGCARLTIADYENGKRTPMPNNLKAIVGALEQAGIEFTADGVKLRPAPEKKKAR